MKPPKDDVRLRRWAKTKAGQRYLERTGGRARHYDGSVTHMNRTSSGWYPTAFFSKEFIAAWKRRINNPAHKAAVKKAEELLKKLADAFQQVDKRKRK